MKSRSYKKPLSLIRHTEWQRSYLNKLIPSPGYYLVNGAIEMFLKNIIKEGAFYLRTPKDVLPKILGSKSIMSTFETGTGATSGATAVREQATKDLFGCDTRKFKPSDYPKYGYLSVADPYTEIMGNNEMSWHYGDAVFVLDKELMMHRTTLTVGTSLNFGVSKYMVPTRVDNVLATCLPGLRNVQMSRGVTDASNLGHYFFFFDSITKQRITPDNFWRICELLGDEAPSFECFELQYHGPLRLGKEIKGLVITDDKANDNLDGLIKGYEDNGVKVTVYL